MDSLIEPEKWYSVKEAAAILGWSGDTVRRQIYKKLLGAFVLPKVQMRNRRVYRSTRIQGGELSRFIRNHMSRN
jgi:hypothetical protein